MITLVHWWVFHYYVKRTQDYQKSLWTRVEFDDRYRQILPYCFAIDLLLGFALYCTLVYFNVI